MLKKSLLPLMVALLLPAGCAYEGTSKLPGVYRIDIQQGNVIDQEMLDQLRPGMPMQQVRFIMGTPVIVDPFHQQRWEYIYSYSEGGKRREQRHIVLHFRDNKLDAISGDVTIGQRPTDAALKEPSRTVAVPPRDPDGFFTGLFDFLPFVGDDRPKARKQPRQDAPQAPTVDTESMPESGP